MDAEVRLHDRPVGRLVYDKGGSAFWYDDDLFAAEHRTLGQVFEESPRAERRARIGLPPWFANLLPEGELRRQVVREMGGGRVGDFRLLVRLGAVLPGAVSVHGSEPDDTDDPTGLQSTAAWDERSLRHSLAGMQLKYSIHSSRLSVPVRGPSGWWIAKLPDPNLEHLVQNEYLTMRWLSDAGMDVPDVALLPAHAVPSIPEGFIAPDDPLFLVRRFDRAAEGRVHVEDFAQVFDAEPREKYGEFGATCDNVGAAIHGLLGDEGYFDYVRRLVAVVVTGNTDAHLKNWGLRYLDGRTPALSPVYDFHALNVYRRFRYAPLALSLGGEQMPQLVTLDNFRRLGDAAEVGPEVVVDLVRETVERLRAAWTGELAKEARHRFPALADHYEGRLTALPIAR
ncbi:type II toxin-antitoxin system HipA family toxin [Dactylosporangium sp. NPDC051541]|uniref:type II toxin-antitoxin system HipA family toxin n=1 Tax=Dactylosporangium sp. NPDC051541 TaxID=3363977 RepID=UPI00379F2663